MSTYIPLPCWGPELEGVNIIEKSEHTEWARGNGIGKTFSTDGPRVTGIDK
jgi:hypothetical protein